MKSEFDFDDLDLGKLTVTSMRDTVALPESGASSVCSCRGSCSCCTCVTCRVPPEPA
ncbi:thiazolylpeptide-type bacteriocin [Streptosporangium sp. NPDC000396]|uniref:thiazolylpeptide-type bacteriocin n=1 Tax=Streptosporangium sp. NPDC000396 TaxID=3366185 RepID=UPI003679B702